MTLTKGRKYDHDALAFTGWTEGDGTATDGYHVGDYFRDGIYLGPDQHGIEPEFKDGPVSAHAYDAAMLARLGYGDVTAEGEHVWLTADDVTALAHAVGGTVDEIETARV